MLLGRLQQSLGAQDVGGQENLWISNAPIHMRFHGEMDNCIKVMLHKERIH